MQEKPYRDELETRSAAELERQRDGLMQKIQARQEINQQIREMHEEGKVHFMTDEEVILMHNFRRFKAQLKAGKRGTFMFKTWADARLIVDPMDAPLIEAADAI